MQRKTTLKSMGRRREDGGHYQQYARPFIIVSKGYMDLVLELERVTN